MGLGIEHAIERAKEERRSKQPSDKELAAQKVAGDEYRGSQQIQNHEEAIRHLRFSINVLIQQEKWHQEKIAKLRGQQNDR